MITTWSSGETRGLPGISIDQGLVRTRIPIALVLKLADVSLVAENPLKGGTGETELALPDVFSVAPLQCRSAVGDGEDVILSPTVARIKQLESAVVAGSDLQARNGEWKQADIIILLSVSAKMLREFGTLQKALNQLVKG